MQFQKSKQKWAGWVDESDFTDGNPLEYYVTGHKFLTKLRRQYLWDSDYDADLYLAKAPDDAEDREAEVELPTNFMMLGILAAGFPIIGRARRRKKIA